MPNLVKLADSISTVTYKKSLQGDLVKFCKAAAKDNLINNSTIENETSAHINIYH